MSLFAGDIDVDIDLDTDVDFSLGDLFSFKGITHFAMGFSTWLTLAGTVAWYSYAIAVLVGIIFMFILYYIYKLTLKLEHSPEILVGEDLVGKSATVYMSHQGNKTEDGFYKYVITFFNGLGLVEEIALSKNEHLETEDIVTIKEFKNSNYFI